MTPTTPRVQLADHINGLTVRTDQFKTQRISLTFMLPLNRESAALASLLSRLLVRSTKQYPTPSAVQRKLLALYGARFSSQVIKLADYQLLNCSITVMNDRFALHGEKLVQEAAAFLLDAVFDPHLEEGAFPAADLAVCRRLQIEALESMLNDKRKYAISKMFSLMCENEPFGIEIGGDIPTVQAATGEQIAVYWRNMLATAPVTVAVIGQEDPAPVFSAVQNCFAGVQRHPCPPDTAFVYRPAAALREAEEVMDVAQGKLVMGFRTNISTMQQDNMALRMMCDIFGGAPYSKLFTVVREQMSLCYYCASRLQSQKGFLCVDSGVDNRNIEAARQGILDQLEAMRQGDFDEAVMEASRLSLIDAARSVTDSQEAMEAWYLARLLDRNADEPDQWIRRVAQVSKQDIQQAARAVTLDTVFALKAREVA